MIKRIVRMSFLPGTTETFLKVFEDSKHQIRGFDGCLHLELWQDKGDKNIFMTYSIWLTADHLEAYRNSELFADTWRKTKILFREKALAWSAEVLHELN